ncbi:MAG: VCBS repeat-containing protein, partial [Candidatus Pacebacteria bacterium]|nr:VCBS repeat-containing protein [Candidatus Paceibacterota bacterium]
MNTAPNTLVLSPTGESEQGLPEESSKSATQDVQNSKSASDIPPEEGAESESNAEMQSMLSESGESTQTRDMSRFEEIRPSDAMGSLSYEYPLAVPPGRNGLQPNLPLTYNNTTHDQHIFGEGWGINIPTIQRINRKGSNTIFSEDYYTSSFDDELVKVNATTYQPRVENGDFRKYTYSSNTWSVADKDGLVYTFGSTTGARLDNPANSSQIATWYLEEVRDQNDNYITFEYYKDNGQIYPSKIIYTGNGVTDGIFDVEFVREARADIATTSDKGFQITTKYRIAEIRTEVNNTWARTYTLGYSSADNGAGSLLTSITESGQDEQSTTIATPAETYSYQTATKDWTENDAWSLPEYVVLDGKDQGVRFMDVNGDGWVDIIRSHSTSSSVQKIYFNDGDSWNYDAGWSVPELFLTGEVDMGVRFGDVNGDGRQDLIRSYTDGTLYKKVYLNTGTSWTYNASWTIPEIVSSGGADLGVQFVDVNGDGLTDLMRSYDDGTQYKKVYINDGDSWEYAASWTVPEVFVDQNGDTGVRLVDINADGLVDMVRSHKVGGTETKNVYLSTGSGWAPEVSWSIPEFITVDSKDQGVQFGDINSDGLIDLVRSYDDGSTTTQKVYVNIGNGWQYESGWTIPQSMLFSKNGSDLGTRLVDANADNLVDFVRSHSSSSVETKLVYEEDGVKSDLLNKIIYPKGGDTTVTYDQTSRYRAPGGDLLNPNLPFVLDVVASVAHNSLLTVSQYDYAYAGGLVNYVGPFDRRFAGFATTTTINDAGHTAKTFFHQGNASNESEGEYADDAWKIGRAYRSDALDESGNLYKRTIHTWESASLGSGSNFVKLTRQTELTYDGDTDHADKATTYTYDENGNATGVVEWGEVTATGDGTFTDTGTDKRTITTTFASSTSPYLVAPATIRVDDYYGTKASESRHYYDTHALGTITEGNLTKEEVWATSTTYADTERTYNAYGLVTEEKDPRDKVTAYTYDTYNLYPATTTNPLSHTLVRSYDYSSGAPRLEKDPNGFVFETTYDGFDRVLEEKQPDVTTPTTLVTKSAYTYTDTGTTSVRVRTYLDGTESYDTYTYFDGLGRPVQEKKATENEGEFITKDIAYNTVGLEHTTSLPYFSASISPTPPTTSANLFVTYLYDPLGRVIGKGTAVGSTTYQYDDWKLTTTDAEGNNKHLYSDAFGNLIRVDEVNGASTYTTTYLYNTNNNLTKITDALGNIRNFSYDALGRRTLAEDLHAPSDTTYGAWGYTYDSASNITSIVDAKGQTINYTFDDINRPLTEDWTGSSSIEAEYAYDTCANGKGRICTATSTNTVTTYFGDPTTTSLSLYEYDPLGRVSKETKYVDKVRLSTAYIGSYTTEFTYNREGNPLTITYPDNSEVRYTYNAGGLLETVEHKESGGSFVGLITDFDYNPLGEVTYRENANNTYTTYTYDPQELYRLRNVRTEKGGVGGAFEDTLVLASTTEPLIAEPVADSTATADLPVAQVQESKTLAQQYEENHTINKRYAIQGARLYTQEKDVDITIGTTKGDVFEPKATFEKWGEARVSIQPHMTTSPSEQTVVFEGEKIIMTAQGQQARFYALPASTQLPAGGFEVDVVLSEKPSTNTLTFDFEAHNLEFLYQPPLDEEVHGDDVVSCTQTVCVNSEGVQVVRRPENVVGSYAVYHAQGKTGDHTKVGGKNYGTGKAFHIYRPLVTDSTGATVWGTLDIDTKQGTLSVTIPQTFLDSAAYPITVDPTIGYTTAGASDTDIDNYARGSLFTTTAQEQGTVDSIRYYGTVESENVHTKAAYYTHSNLALVAVGSETTGGYVDPTFGWFTSTVSGSPALNSSTEYVLVAWGDDDGVDEPYLAYDSGSTNQGHSDSATYGASFPNPLVPSHQTRKYSIYLTYTSGGSGNATPTAPTALLAEGQTNPTNISDPTPEFSAVYNDPDAGDIANKYRVQVSASSTSWTSLVWDSGTTTMASTTAGNRSPDISYAGSALASSTTYYWRVAFVDQGGLASPWSTTTSSFSLAAGEVGGNATPTAPTALLTEGQVDPADIVDNTPEFSALYNDPDAGDIANKYQLQVSTSSSVWTSLVWDSATTAMASTTAGNRSPDIAYAGAALASSTTYYWRIKFWDDDGAEGAWSTTTASFSLAAGGSGNATPTAPTALLAEGQTNPTSVTDSTPEFSATYNDPNTGDTTNKYHIQVSTSSSVWTSLVWDSGTTSMATTTQGTRSPDIPYIGSALASSTTYFWRVRFTDSGGLTGDWSTTTASFSLVAGSSPSSTSTTVRIYPISGDGDVSHTAASWSGVHDASWGTSASYTGSTGYVNVGKTGTGSYAIKRAFIPFDTSIIPDTATVTAATLNVYVNSKQNSDNDGDDYLTVVQTTSMFTSSLSMFDYASCGAVTNPGEGIDAGDRQDISNITTGQYMSFSLNATGTSWINTEL